MFKLLLAFRSIPDFPIDILGYSLSARFLYFLFLLCICLCKSPAGNQIQKCRKEQGVLHIAMFWLYNRVNIINSVFIQIKYTQQIAPGESLLFEPCVRYNHGFLLNANELQPYFVQRRILCSLSVIDIIGAAIYTVYGAGHLYLILSHIPMKSDFAITVI